jgi:glycosyltransferase involved in cell wall biosynthesis
MKIAQVAPLYESVPPSLYGGTERVVSYITEELVEQGHDVTLFASGDSITRARLISPCARSLRLDPEHLDPMAPHTVLLDQVFERVHEFDVVHFHIDYLHFPMSRLAQIPNVTTLHGRLDLPQSHVLLRHFDEMPLVSISDAQRRPVRDARWVGTVYHGLPEDLYSFNERPKRYLAFIGRISPEKRLDRAIRIARAAGLPLRVAAKVDKADQVYFRRVIEPMLSEPGVEFVGEVGEEEKNDLLGNALALLFPIDWPEPFGLTMIEALACGTPVIAWPCGSVPEVIDEGYTGFICRNIAEAVQAVARVGGLNRQHCRRVFEERFTARRMVQDYVRIYQRVLEWNRVGKDGEHGRNHPRSGTLLHTRNIVPS